MAGATVCGPWPGLRPPAWAVITIVLGLVVLARPRGREILAWIALAAALLLSILPAMAPVPSQPALSAELEAHCRQLLRVAEASARDDSIRRLVSVTGEAVDPIEPFRALERHLPPHVPLTLFLADDQGRIVAWAGEGSALPEGLRTLGERSWRLAWSAIRARLVLREPVLTEGRLAGSVLVVSSAPLGGLEAFGVQSPRGRRIKLGLHPGALSLSPPSLRPLSVPVAMVPVPPSPSFLRWAVWLLAVALCLFDAPEAALAGAAMIGLCLAVGGEIPAVISGSVMLLTTAAASRAARRACTTIGRFAVLAGALAGVLVLALEVLPRGFEVLPARVTHPGWGAILALCAAWLLGSVPRAARWSGGALGKRLLVALVIALLLGACEAVRLPLLASWERPPEGPTLPRHRPDLADVLPAPPSNCSLDDLATALSLRWDLDQRRVPTEVRILDAKGEEVSVWGSLEIPRQAALPLRNWEVQTEDSKPLTVELLGGGGPWSRLQDWSPLPGQQRSPLWWAVFSRSGEVEATLHPEVRGLEPVTAGNLFHRGAGWAMVRVGWRRFPAHVVREGDFLTARILLVPAPAVWALRMILAALWALVGLAVALPPRRWLPPWDTFGGRLRLLVAGGILVPLSLLTLLMQEGLRADEARQRRATGSAALSAVQWTLDHLAGGVAVDSSLARSLAEQTGAEIVLFGDPFPLASSRPDLIQVGLLPSLPLPEAYAHHLLGRTDPVLSTTRGQVLASASSTAAGQPVLVAVTTPDPVQAGGLPGVADWLLAGALIAALFSLALTAGIERRLGASLQALIEVARRIQAGQPPASMVEPQEQDLAEVVRAVRRMSQEVARRETRLRQQEELLRITLATLEPAVLVLDPTGGILLSNPSAEKLLEDHGQTALDHVGSLTAEDDPSSATVAPYPGRDLTWRLGVASVPLPDGNEGRVAVIEDITEVVRVDRLRQLTQLARIVAHEVKNPLTPVRLWVQEVEAALRRPGEPLRELVTEACREISTQVDRLQATSQAFSNLVALERWAADATDLATVANEAAAGFRILERREIRLELDLPTNGQAVVTGDRQWLRRMALNLLQNSVDAVGSGPGWIRLSIRTDETHVELSVADSGGGVPEERLEELFEPHFSTTSGGSGLGLALVRMVASRLGGTVEAKNGRDGLEVTVRLPAASDTMTS